MKKIVLAISLAAIVIISGCASGTAPEVSPPAAQQPVSEKLSAVLPTELPEASPEPTPSKDNNAKLASLLERVQNNFDTRTIEGFTAQSTFSDVAASGMQLHQATYTFAVDFLSFPANIYYSFAPSQRSLTYDILPDEHGGYEEKLADILSSLDAAYGSHTEKTAYGGWLFYTWNSDTCTIHMQTMKDDFTDLGRLGMIMLDDPGTSISPANIPRIFYALFGAKYSTELENEMIAVLNSKERAGIDFRLVYIADGMGITFKFKRDVENNSFILSYAEYALSADMDACLSGLENILGDADKCEYTYKIAGIEKTVKEMPNMNVDEFRLDASWFGIDLTGYCTGKNVSLYLNFDDTYFLKTYWNKD